MGIFSNTFTAVTATVKRLKSELNAAYVLQKSMDAIAAGAAPHWRSASPDDLPDMIRELARDRDDFKKMSASYREDLAASEAKVRALEEALKWVSRSGPPCS